MARDHNKKKNIQKKKFIYETESSIWIDINDSKDDVSIVNTDPMIEEKDCKNIGLTKSSSDIPNDANIKCRGDDVFHGSNKLSGIDTSIRTDVCVPDEIVIPIKKDTIGTLSTKDEFLTGTPTEKSYEEKSKEKRNLLKSSKDKADNLNNPIKDIKDGIMTNDKNVLSNKKINDDKKEYKEIGGLNLIIKKNKNEDLLVAMNDDSPKGKQKISNDHKTSLLGKISLLSNSNLELNDQLMHRINSITINKSESRINTSTSPGEEFKRNAPRSSKSLETLVSEIFNIDLKANESILQRVLFLELRDSLYYPFEVINDHKVYLKCRVCNTDIKLNLDMDCCNDCQRSDKSVGSNFFASKSLNKIRPDDFKQNVMPINLSSDNKCTINGSIFSVDENRSMCTQESTSMRKDNYSDLDNNDVNARDLFLSKSPKLPRHSSQNDSLSKERTAEECVGESLSKEDCKEKELKKAQKISKTIISANLKDVKNELKAKNIENNKSEYSGDQDKHSGSLSFGIQKKKYERSSDSSRYEIKSSSPDSRKSSHDSGKSSSPDSRKSSSPDSRKSSSADSRKSSDSGKSFQDSRKSSHDSRKSSQYSRKFSQYSRKSSPDSRKSSQDNQNSEYSLSESSLELLNELKSTNEDKPKNGKLGNNKHSDLHNNDYIKTTFVSGDLNKTSLFTNDLNDDVNNYVFNNKTSIEVDLEEIVLKNASPEIFEMNNSAMLVSNYDDQGDSDKNINIKGDDNLIVVDIKANDIKAKNIDTSILPSISIVPFQGFEVQNLNIDKSEAFAASDNGGYIKTDNESIKTKSINDDGNIKTKSINDDGNIKTKSINEDENIKTKSINEGESIKTKSINEGASIKNKSINEGASIKNKSINEDESIKTKSINEDENIKTTGKGKNEDESIKTKTDNEDESIKTKSKNDSNSINQKQNINENNSINDDQILKDESISREQNKNLSLITAIEHKKLSSSNNDSSSLSNSTRKIGKSKYNSLSEKKNDHITSSIHNDSVDTYATHKYNAKSSHDPPLIENNEDKKDDKSNDLDGGEDKENLTDVYKINKLTDNYENDDKGQISGNLKEKSKNEISNNDKEKSKDEISYNDKEKSKDKDNDKEKSRNEISDSDKEKSKDKDNDKEKSKGGMSGNDKKKDKDMNDDKEKSKDEISDSDKEKTKNEISVNDKDKSKDEISDSDKEKDRDRNKYTNLDESNDQLNDDGIKPKLPPDLKFQDPCVINISLEINKNSSSHEYNPDDSKEQIKKVNVMVNGKNKGDFKGYVEKEANKGKNDGAENQLVIDIGKIEMRDDLSLNLKLKAWHMNESDFISEEYFKIKKGKVKDLIERYEEEAKNPE